jgi:hypothetical protein
VATPPVPPPAYPPTSTIDVHINHRDRHATLVVETFGTDFIGQVEQTIRDLHDENLHVIYVDLPLDDPGTLDAAPRLQEHEFVLAGLMPMFHHQRDFLRMQRLLVDLDFDLIEVYSDRAHALKQTIREELEWNTHTVTTR